MYPIQVILAGTLTGVQGDIQCKVLVALSTVWKRFWEKKYLFQKNQCTLSLFFTARRAFRINLTCSVYRISLILSSYCSNALVHSDNGLDTLIGSIRQSRLHCSNTLIVFLQHSYTLSPTVSQYFFHTLILLL